MKRYLIDVGAGFGLFVVILFAEFLVTLPIPSPVPDAERWSALLAEFGLTAPCALVLSGALAWVMGTTTVAVGVRRGLIWLAVVSAVYVALALGNSNQVMFTVPTLYVLLAAVPLGPIVVGAVRGRSAR